MSDDRTRPAPADRFAPEHLVFDLHAEVAALEAEPAPGRGHRQKALYKNSGRTVALFLLDAGATLAEHSAAGPVTIQAIEGELQVTAAGASHRLHPGMLLVMAPGVRHDVRAQSRAVFLLQVSLAPTPQSR
jgi:quercetin dioxygenase-like cupin family protein